MLTLPRLPLPGTLVPGGLDLPRHKGGLMAGTFIWSPITMDDEQAKRYPMSYEDIYYALGRGDSEPYDDGSDRAKQQRSRLACLRCRTKKTKCDGALPCNHCIKGRFECSYEERRRPELSEKALSGKLAMLQSRFKALSPAGSSKSTSSGPSSSSGKSPGTLSSPSFSQTTIDPLSTDLRDHLLRIAIKYLPRCNFNVDGPGIFASLQLSPEQQIHPSMVSAMMLLGSYYAKADQLPPGTPPPDYFIQLIRSQMSDALSDVDRLLCAVGASVMLAWWLLQNGRFLEGQYEISSAVRLAINCGLHQIDGYAIRAVLGASGSRLSSQYSGGGLLGPPKNLKDIENRLGMFWGIFLMDKNTAIMTGLPPSFDEQTNNPALRITSVWPRQPGTWELPWTDDDFTSVDDLTLSSQLQEQTTIDAYRPVKSPQTVIAATAQSMTLLHRAVRLSCHNPRTLAEAQSLRNSLITLNQAISHYTNGLPRETTIADIASRGVPYPFGANTPESAYFCMAEVRSGAYVVIIKMHQAAHVLEHFEGGVYRLSAGLGMGDEKRVAAARAVSLIAEEVSQEFKRPGVSMSAKDGVCLVIGFLWTSAAVVLLEKVASLRQSLVQLSQASVDEIRLYTNDFDRIFSAIRMLSTVFPVLDLQVEKLRGMAKETGIVGWP